MTLLSGCDKRNNREWLENKFGTELSRVYPTQNVEDLFKEFPDGFKIDQSYRTGGPHGLLTQMVLVGDGETHSILGTLNQIDLSTKDEKETASVVVEYQNGELVFSDEEKAKEIWPFNGFLFQHLTVDKSHLNNLEMTDKNYNFQNGAFSISYHSQNENINHYLDKKKNKFFTLRLAGSNYKKDNYYYVLSIEYDEATEFSEIISD
ncbi:hypothetical protein ACVRZS_02245 [Streptococcus ferus]|uniref:Lipoprotein n=1 Tax=Streptococcus ferus TaxID=1345 RepID=A0A2X3VGD4_9STRE|nr:hypothetical protein [Streptococcus ferus]SQF40530.1 lipoprotein [Streptococcus ferus]